MARENVVGGVRVLLFKSFEAGAMLYELYSCQEYILLFHGTSLKDGNFLEGFGRVGQITKIYSAGTVQNDPKGTLHCFMASDKDNCPSKILIKQRGCGDQQRARKVGLMEVNGSHATISSWLSQAFNPIPEIQCSCENAADANAAANKSKKSLAYGGMIGFSYNPFSPEPAVRFFISDIFPITPWPKKSQDRSSFRFQPDKPTRLPR